MPDVTERARGYIAESWSINDAAACALMAELIAELEAARAENKRLSGEFRKARGWKFGPVKLDAAVAESATWRARAAGGGVL